MIYTQHAQNNRQSRLNLCKQIDEGASIVGEFYWDKGHKDGPEIHKISSHGIIWIYNAITNRFITALIARPGQIKRYYGGNPPEYLMEIARKHQLEGLNYK